MDALNACSVFQMHRPYAPGCAGEPKPHRAELAAGHTLDLDTMRFHNLDDPAWPGPDADLVWLLNPDAVGPGGGPLFDFAATGGSTLHVPARWHANSPSFEGLCVAYLDAQPAPDFVEGVVVPHDPVAGEAPFIVRSDLGAYFKVGNIAVADPDNVVGTVFFDVATMRIPQGAEPPNDCAEGLHVVGRYSEWLGKVNVHAAEGGRWQVDAGCRRGQSAPRPGYCQSFWPTTTAVVQTGSPNDNGRTAILKPFMTLNCAQMNSGVGEEEYACCAPD